jgi:hypothetical protein
MKTDKPGRNDACPCGSGKKYKKCCQAADDVREAEAERARRAKPAIDPSSLRGEHKCDDPTHDHGPRKPQDESKAQGTSK